MNGQDIKNIREKNNLTQTEFAEKIGTSYPRVSDWENDKRKISLSYQKIIRFIFSIK